jgi:surfeit locus 1 family protein
MPFRLLPVYLQLSEQDPPQVEGLPAPAPLPELSEGPHLGYALQWFAFATIALVGYVVLLRRGRRPAADGDSPEHEAPASFEGGARWDA